MSDASDRDSRTNMDDFVSRVAGSTHDIHVLSFHGDNDDCEMHIEQRIGISAGEIEDRVVRAPYKLVVQNLQTLSH